MRVIITAGGTGGHIYPALAIVDEIKKQEPNSEFIYIGTHNRMEKDIVPEKGIKYVGLEIYGLSTSLKLMGRNIKNIFLINKATKRAKEIIKNFKPDIVIGVGGYVTYPVIKAAHKLGVKTFIHEQNSIPGKANKSLLKYVDKVGISFEESRNYLKHNNIVFTGNPCSTNAINIEPYDLSEYGIKKNRKSVLIFNGSLGSSVINNKLLEYLGGADKYNYDIIYVTGKIHYDKFKTNNFPENVHIYPYINNLCGVMKSVNVVVGRAGASSVAEIEAIGVPCILIPSPYVANNHQYYNALAIQNSNAGYMIQEPELTSELLMNRIDSLINDDKLASDMSKNLKKLSVDNSANVIYKEIKKII